MEKEIKKYSRKKTVSKKQKAIKTIKSFRNEDGTKKETDIEKIVRLILEELQLEYIQEHPISYFDIKAEKYHYKVYDFYVTDGLTYGFLIEVDSTYWHGLEYTEGEKKYKTLSKIQKKNIKNDKLKNRIAQEKAIPLLRIKDKDLKNNKL